MAPGLRLPIPIWLRRFPGIVVLVDAEGIVVDSNGRLDDEMGAPVRGRAFADLLDAPSSQGKWERILAGADAADDERVWELILRGPEGPLDTRAFAVLRDDEGDELMLVEQRRDPRLDDLRERVLGVNTELVNTQRTLLKERARLAWALDQLQARSAELERSNQALDAFAHVVSHDLKAPLRSIANYAAWLDEDAASALPPESREHLHRLRGRAERMSAMIDGVLAYARAGRERSPVESVAVAALLGEVVELLDPPRGTEVSVDPGLPVLTSERAPLQQVFLNLVGNAIRFATRSPEPRVTVRAEPRGEHWEFAVADNGPGVPPGQERRIWDLFRTLETEERGGGTGIGLAVVKRLVEAQGGRAWVEPTPGGGATFRFLWPRSAEPR